MVTLGQLLQQPLALLDLLGLRALSARVLKAGHELFGQQVLRQLSQVLFEQAGYGVGLVFLQVGRFLAIIGCFELIDF